MTAFARFSETTSDRCGAILRRSRSIRIYGKSRHCAINVSSMIRERRCRRPKTAIMDENADKPVEEGHPNYLKSFGKWINRYNDFLQRGGLLIVRWWAFGALALTVLFLSALVTNAALSKSVPSWTFLALIGVAVASIVAMMAISYPDEGSWREPQKWRSQRFVAIAFLVVFTAFGTLEDIYNLVAPRPVIESEPGKVQESIADIQRRTTRIEGAILDDRDADRDLYSKVRGRWGENEMCDVVWTIDIIGAALVAEATKRPPDSPPWRFVATITGANQASIEVRGEAPSQARGYAATFQYESNGVVEKLFWIDRTKLAPLELIRC